LELELFAAAMIVFVPHNTFSRKWLVAFDFSFRFEVPTYDLE